MIGPRVRSRPSGYVITIDNAVLADVGKNGIVKDEFVAVRLRRLIELTRPESDVLLFGYFELTGAS
jgi:hypothetical protein